MWFKFQELILDSNSAKIFEFIVFAFLEESDLCHGSTSFKNYCNLTLPTSKYPPCVAPPSPWPGPGSWRRGARPRPWSCAAWRGWAVSWSPSQVRSECECEAQDRDTALSVTNTQYVFSLSFRFYCLICCDIQLKWCVKQCFETVVFNCPCVIRGDSFESLFS